MKKRLIIASTIALGVVLALLALAAYGRATPVSVTGNLTQQDVALIRRDYEKLERQNVSKAVASADPLFLVGALRHLAFGRIRKVGSPDDGYAVVSTGYVWNSDIVWVCDLVRTTNGWCLP